MAPMETEIRRVPAAATRPLRRRILRPHQSADELDYRGDGDLETFHVAALAGAPAG